MEKKPIFGPGNCNFTNLVWFMTRAFQSKTIPQAIYFYYHFELLIHDQFHFVRVQHDEGIVD